MDEKKPIKKHCIRDYHVQISLGISSLGKSASDKCIFSPRNWRVKLLGSILLQEEETASEKEDLSSSIHILLLLRRLLGHRYQSSDFRRLFLVFNMTHLASLELELGSDQDLWLQDIVLPASLDGMCCLYLFAYVTVWPVFTLCCRWCLSLKRFCSHSENCNMIVFFWEFIVFIDHVSVRVKYI